MTYLLVAGAVALAVLLAGIAAVIVAQSEIDADELDRGYPWS